MTDFQPFFYLFKMENMFKKIGDRIEEKKKKKKRFVDNYWKLSASERMDYDQKLQRLKNSFRPLALLTALLSGIVYLGIFCFVGYVFISPEFMTIGKMAISVLILLLPFVLVAEIIAGFIISIDIESKKKQLAKRFKLIK